MADLLFLLKPQFDDAKAGTGTFYCPGCATVTGLLTYFPKLRDELDIREVGFLRPRPEVAELFGEKHPGCPLLVLDSASDLPVGLTPVVAENGRAYFLGAEPIGQYLAARYGVSAPHP
jgi:Protein of unknown function (DUF3088)